LELSILQGAKKTLQDSRLRSLVVELSLTHDAERDQASSYLEECGFQLQSVGEGQSTSEGVGANHLFVRKTDR